jgi:hypothetical protein
VRDAVTGDPGGVARSWAIVEGTAVTAVSYLRTRRRLRRRPDRSAPAGTAAAPAEPGSRAGH